MSLPINTQCLNKELFLKMIKDIPFEIVRSFTYNQESFIFTSYKDNKVIEVPYLVLNDNEYFKSKLHFNNNDNIIDLDNLGYLFDDMLILIKHIYYNNNIKQLIDK